MTHLKMENREEVKQVNPPPTPKKARKVRKEDGFYSGGYYYKNFEDFIKESVEVAMEHGSY